MCQRSSGPAEPRSACCSAGSWVAVPALGITAVSCLFNQSRKKRIMVQNLLCYTVRSEIIELNSSIEWQPERGGAVPLLKCLNSAFN